MSDALSSLIKLKLDLLSTAEQFKLSAVINDKICAVDSLKLRNSRNSQIDYSAELSTIIDYYQNLKSCDQEITRLVDLATEKIDRDIDQLVQERFTSDEYCQKFSHKINHTNILAKETIIEFDEGVKSQLTARVTQFSDWHYPGLIMGCKSIDWINCLVSTDPLYLTNYDTYNINSIIQQYSDIYQRRLRIYNILNNDYSELPQGQFGLILGWEYFNYLNLKEIEKNIIEAFKLLRPGGVFIFSYNNCDLISGAETAENSVMSYCSARKIQQLAEIHGFEILALSDIPIGDETYKFISWAELRKPGELKTIKLHQVLGVIGQK
jgi:SAM-dependent methyltransferase